MNNNDTMLFKIEKENKDEIRNILLTVYNSLNDKGYNAVNQIIGYILSGDPTYVTNHNNARSLIRKLERDEILEELLKSYLNIK